MTNTHFKLVSETGDGIGFAIRLAQLGHRVSAWIRSADAKSVGDGLVEKVGDLEDLIHDASPENDVFIFDVTGNGVVADFLRNNSFAVLGGSILADRLERDRTFGYKVMSDGGIEVPETKSFTDFDAAKQFVEEHSDVRWVYKPSKQLGDLSPSHVSYDAEDLIEMLTNIAHEVDIETPQFELQAFEKGIALSTEFWFQNGEFIPGLTNHTLERKELMNGDIGPSGGCLGNIVWMCDGCPACEEYGKLLPWFRKERYHGMCDLNTIVSPKGIYGLEFTPRFGYDASPTLFWELIEGDLGDSFAELARGTLREVSTRSGFAGAVRITIPPWPTEKYTAEENVPIRGLNDDWEKSTYLYNVKSAREDPSDLRTAGAWGIVLLCTGYSVNPSRALDKPLDACKAVRLKNRQFRTDLAKQFEDDLEKLEAVIHQEVR